MEYLIEKCNGFNLDGLAPYELNYLGLLIKGKTEAFYQGIEECPNCDSKAFLKKDYGLECAWCGKTLVKFDEQYIAQEAIQEAVEINVKTAVEVFILNLGQAMDLDHDELDQLSEIVEMHAREFDSRMWSDRD